MPFMELEGSLSRLQEPASHEYLPVEICANKFFRYLISMLRFIKM